jgi:flagellin-like hook-associated protein FlgL
MPIPLTQTTQPIAIDSKSRQEPNDSSSVPSYVRSDSVSVGDRGAEQTTTEMSSNISMIQPRQSEIPTAQQIRDIATAETAAVTTYADILAQQKQGLSAQANQNPLQVVKLLK